MEVVEEQVEGQQEQQPPETPARTQTQSKVSFPSSPKRKKQMNKRIFVILGILLVAGVAGWFIFKGSKSPSTLSPTPTPFIEGTSTISTPTPAPVDKSEIEIEVFNGTGIAREASFLQGKLRDLGYTEIETGNTEDQDESETVTKVTFSSSVAEEVVDEITEELEEIYKDVDVRTSRSLEVDVQIITGLRKGQTAPTPTPTGTITPTPTPTPTGTLTPTPTPDPTL